MNINNKMTTIADKIRGLIGSSKKMSLDAMATNLDIEKNNIDAALNAVANKGVIVPNGSNSGNLSSLIDAIGSANVIKKEGTSFCQYGDTQYVRCIYDEEDSSGLYIDINVGFRPDLVIIHPFSNRAPTESNENIIEFDNLAVWFSPEYIDNPLAWWNAEAYLSPIDTSIFYMAKPNNDGVTLYYLYWWDDNGAHFFTPETEFEYTAIKFT